MPAMLAASGPTESEAAMAGESSVPLSTDCCAVSSTGQDLKNETQTPPKYSIQKLLSLRFGSVPEVTKKLQLVERLKPANNPPPAEAPNCFTAADQLPPPKKNFARNRQRPWMESGPPREPPRQFQPGANGAGAALLQNLLHDGEPSQNSMGMANIAFPVRPVEHQAFAGMLNALRSVVSPGANITVVKADPSRPVDPHPANWPPIRPQTHNGHDFTRFPGMSGPPRLPPQPSYPLQPPNIPTTDAFLASASRGPPLPFARPRPTDPFSGLPSPLGCQYPFPGGRPELMHPGSGSGDLQFFQSMVGGRIVPPSPAVLLERLRGDYGPPDDFARRQDKWPQQREGGGGIRPGAAVGRDAVQWNSFPSLQQNPMQPVTIPEFGNSEGLRHAQFQREGGPGEQLSDPASIKSRMHQIYLSGYHA